MAYQFEVDHQLMDNHQAYIEDLALDMRQTVTIQSPTGYQLIILDNKGVGHVYEINDGNPSGEHKGTLNQRMLSAMNLDLDDPLYLLDIGLTRIVTPGEGPRYDLICF